METSKNESAPKLNSGETQNIQFSKLTDNFISANDFDSAIKLLQMERGDVQNDLILTMRLCCGMQRHEYESFAIQHFEKLLGRVRTDNYNLLINLLQFAKVDSRLPFLEEFINILIEKIKTIDPNWQEGTRFKPNPEGKETPANLRLDIPPEEVIDPDVALANAKHCPTNILRSQYLKKFIEIGGDENNVDYLKLKYRLAITNVEDILLTPLFINKISKSLTPVKFRQWVKSRLQEKKQYSIPKQFINDLVRNFIAVEPKNISQVDLLMFCSEALARDSIYFAECALNLIKDGNLNIELVKVRQQLLTKFDFIKGVDKNSGTFTNPVYDETGRIAINSQTFRVVDGKSEDFQK